MLKLEIDQFISDTAWKVSKYGVFSSWYFTAFGLNTERYSVSLNTERCSVSLRIDTPFLSVFSPNAGKHGPEKTQYLDSFQVVMVRLKVWKHKEMHLKCQNTYMKTCWKMFSTMSKPATLVTIGLVCNRDNNCIFW